MSRLPLRTRLVAGFLVAMLVLLSAAGAFVYWRVQLALDGGLDNDLANATSTITPLVSPDGHVNSPSADATGAGWQVLSPEGEVIGAGGTAPDRELLSERQLPRSGERTLDVGSVFRDNDLGTYRVRVTRLSDGKLLLVAVRRDHRDEALRELVAQLVIAGTVSLAIAALVGDRLARAALRPVERYRRSAAEIAGGAGDLRLDVPEARDDEVTRLGHTLNEMLGALEESMARERRFVNDASHELRTPLTLLRSRIQLARRRPRSVEDHERILDELAVDVARLTELTEQLLDLGTPTVGGSSDAVAVAEALVQRSLAADPDRTLTVTAGGRAVVGLPERAVERIVTNLVDNAFTHGAPPVSVRVRTTGSYAVIAVSDAGPGMSSELLASAPGRFTRSPEARSRPGSGLGLSLVEGLATAAGGQLRLCHAGQHVNHGPSLPVECDHGPEMTVSVVLPLAE
ncbi:HAMP domain-containing sensor histidine kinase [Nocardioides panacihumi]|uniref:sensor histidine kinase n=1 Tax=Nocardioides panacihumi TaxID=400774 RepID=UPI0031DA3F9A